MRATPFWDLRELPGNEIGARNLLGEKRHAVPDAFFQTNADTLSSALRNTPVLAGRVAEDARRGINDIVTRSSILRGANARFAAREILSNWGHALEGLRLSARARASFIARTETARIQSEADLVTMERLGVEKVDVFYSAGAFPCEVCPAIAAGGGGAILERSSPGGRHPVPPELPVFVHPCDDLHEIAGGDARSCSQKLSSLFLDTRNGDMLIACARDSPTARSGPDHDNPAAHPRGAVQVPLRCRCRARSR